MRKAVLCLAPIVVVSAVVFGCEDDTNPVIPNIDFDAGQFDGNVPQQDGGGPTPDDSGTDAGPAVVTVQIMRGAQPEANVEVVFSDADGAVLGTAATGTDGKATSALGSTPSMATALLSIGASGTPQRQVMGLTWVGVKPGDTLLADDLGSSEDLITTSWSIVPQGDFTDGGAGSYGAAVGPLDFGCQAGPVAAEPFALQPARSCLRATNAVLAKATTAADEVTPIAFAFKKAVAPPNDAGVPVALGPWLAPAKSSVLVTNPPAFPTVSLFQIVGTQGVDSTSAIGYLDGGEDFAVAPAFAEALQGVVRSFPSQNQTLSVQKRVTAPAATVTIDFGTALPLVSNAALDSTDVKRPSVSWTAASTLASTSGGGVTITYNKSGVELQQGWAFVVPPSAATGSVKVPALPPDAAEWLPGTDDAGTTFFGAPEVFFAATDALPTYDAYRQLAGRLAPAAFSFDRTADVVLPANGSLRVTRYQNRPLN